MDSTDTRTGPGADIDIDPDDVHDAYDRAGYAELTDAQLFDVAAHAVSVPRRDPASSFVLHAPLELMARRLLLPLVPPGSRRPVREQMIRVAAAYERAGAPVEPPRAVPFDSAADARRGLLDAIAAGDLERVDAAASHLLDRATLDEVMVLAGPTVDALAAAGHAPIAFFFANRLASTSRSSLTLLRGPLRELARAPQLRVEWVREAGAPTGTATALVRALARTPQLGLPGNDFIFPLVHRVDADGVARDVVDGSLPGRSAEAAAAILRVAARSMLQDDPAHAPYGWTHCLTLPHAICEILPWLPDRRVASAVAATYVVAFRAGESRGPLDTDWIPGRTPTGLLEALDAGPDVAGAAWFHAPERELARALPVLIGRAAGHHDAHVVKYTLACLAAAERDRAQRSLYYAAAASLVAWWSARSDTAFREDL